MNKKYKSYLDDYEDEYWATYLDFTDYLISNYGRIKIVKTNKIKIQLKIKNKKGYRCVRLLKKGHPYDFKVHRLVLLTFCGDPPSGHIACHNNGNSLDNRLINLRWATSKENKKDQKEHCPSLDKNSKFYPKISENDILQIRSFLAYRGLNTKLALHYGVTYRFIYDVRNYRTWKHI